MCWWIDNHLITTIIIIEKIGQIKICPRMTIEALQINMYEQHISTFTLGCMAVTLKAITKGKNCGFLQSGLSVGFYCQAILSLTHKATFALLISVHLVSEWKQSCDLYFCRFLRFNIENYFPSSQDVTDQDKRKNSNHPSPENIMSLNHVCGFRYNKLLKPKYVCDT